LFNALPIWIERGHVSDVPVPSTAPADVRVGDVAQGIQGIVQGLLDLLFPPRCVVCRRSGSILCRTCLASVRAPAEPLCLRCGAPLPLNQSHSHISHALCVSCLDGRGPTALDGLRVAAVYEGTIRKAIHALKYENKRRAAQPLGALLAAAYHRSASVGMRADLIIPVPLHADRVRERGYNQAGLLARAVAARLGLPLNDKLVIRQRATQTQVGLPWRARRANVTGAFALTDPQAAEHLAGRRILLIDDVATTGSTLDATAQALATAGPASIWGLALARPALRPTSGVHYPSREIGDQQE